MDESTGGRPRPPVTDMEERIRRSEKRAADYRSLLEVAAALNSAGSLPGLLHTIMRKCREVMNAETSSLMLYDPDTQELVFEVALSPVGDQMERSRRFRLPLGTGIAGHVGSTQTPFITNDAYSCDLFYSGHDEKTGYRTRNILCAPIHLQGALIGVAQIINSNDGRDFTEEDLEIFEPLLHLAAVAIHTARLREEHEQHVRHEREMSISREIQRKFLPAGFPDAPGWSFDADMHPARRVGGDVWDGLRLGDGRMVCTVGDVSGKGVSAALYGASLLAELRLLLEFCATPADAMARFNRIMYDRSWQGMFATLILAAIDLDSGETEILCAGHPPPVLRSADGAVRLVDVDADPPLGVVKDTEYAQTSVVLEPGEMLLLYSDGVPEARNPDGEMLGYEEVADLFGRANAHPDGPLTGLWEAVTAFCGPSARQDDITALIVSRDGSANAP